MLGRPLEAMYPASTKVAAAHPLLTVENLTVPGVLRDWSMVARRGKILCIAGQIGSGAQDVIRALAGLVPEAAGKVTVNGAPLRLGSVPRALARNILFISEDRAAEGLFLGRTVLENFIVLRLTVNVRFGLLRWPKLHALAARLAVRVGIDRRRLPARVDELSGGNQQKLLFGRGLERAVPGILLMNEPTRGVDVGSRAEIYRLMREFCDMGYTLVMTSSDLEEVVGISRRCYHHVPRPSGRPIRWRKAADRPDSRGHHTPRCDRSVVMTAVPPLPRSSARAWLPSLGGVSAVGWIRIVVLFLLIAGCLTTPGFVSEPSINAVLTMMSYAGCVAIGMTFITISGNIMTFVSARRLRHRRSSFLCFSIEPDWRSQSWGRSPSVHSQLQRKVGSSVGSAPIPSLSASPCWR